MVISSVTVVDVVQLINIDHYVRILVNLNGKQILMRNIGAVKLMYVDMLVQ